jgi:hypothetical protein
MDTPRKKPLAKCAKLLAAHRRRQIPSAKANVPAAVDKRLLLRIMLPPKQGHPREGANDEPGHQSGRGQSLP